MFSVNAYFYALFNPLNIILGFNFSCFYLIHIHRTVYSMYSLTDRICVQSILIIRILGQSGCEI